MNCCRSSQRNSSLERPASSARQIIIDQQPIPLAGLQPPTLHHPDVAHQSSPASAAAWDSSNSPPLPPATANYPGAYAYPDDGYFPDAAPPAPDEGKLVIAIDFGTTFSGVAYGSSRIASGKIQQILNWPGSSETFRKACACWFNQCIPTCLLYDEDGRILAWGLEAKNASPMPGTARYEWFKLFLDPRALREGAAALDPRLPELPDGKTPTDLITDFMSCLWEYAREQITRDIGAVADLNSADVWLTVPASWDARGCALMRDAALMAGLVQSAHAGDGAWRARLHIISEPEAAAVHCARLTALHTLRAPQTFVVCDAGGGTVDLAVYQITGDSGSVHLEIAELAARSGANCGSLFLDLRFRALVQTLLADHPAHLEPASLASFMHSFSEADKLAYAGYEDDETTFYFNCFNVEGARDDRRVGLVNGQLAIPGHLLREAVFDPVVDEVLHLIHTQLTALPAQTADALLLVGGFAGSAYLMERVETTFRARIPLIARPPDADTATLRGAARHALERRPLVAQVVAARGYGVRAKLPAEAEDRVRRPAYISRNAAGVQVCANRLQYLVHKGAVLRKGQRVTTRFCKFSRDGGDSRFVSTLYAVDGDGAPRYADDGGVRALCEWTADLGGLPEWQAAAAAARGGDRGFYTDFCVGLELDSAEVRGVVVSAVSGRECGRYVNGGLGPGRGLIEIACEC
ncbi:hypothetical protein B0H10DRAFT_1794150 [Mycena sp. CBHHK59/15]|nr:hypothetical protein B0H10DRAFT_1794150 [Mycena sp. CBHHK59/15]